MRAALQPVLDRRVVEAAARAEGVVRRQRKVDVYALIWTLVLGFHLGETRTLSGLRQLYQQVSGQRLSPSSFYERLSSKMASLLRRLAQEALAAQPRGMALPSGALAGFQELLAVDATVLKLHSLLQRAFPGTASPASAKLHVVMNVCDGSARRVKLTSGQTGDTAPWQRVGGWVRDRLLLFDLGYYHFHLWHCIDQNGGFFLSRAKTNCNPVITAVNRTWRGRSIDVVGQTVQEVLPRLDRELLDVEVEVSYAKRAYRGKQATLRRTFRLVAVRNDKTGHYHTYLTNIPADKLPAEQIRATYALRWQVELLFKAMKSHGHLDHLPSTKRCVVECLVWASVLAAVASAALYKAVRHAVDAHRYLPPLRWAALFARFALPLLELVLHLSRAPQALWALLLEEAVDPNRKRADRAFEHVPVLPSG